MRRVPRISRHAVSGSLRRGAHRKLVHVGLSDDHSARFPEIDHRLRRKSRNKILQYLRGAGCQHAFCAHIVLHRHRHTRERSCQLAFFNFFLHGRRRSQCLFPVDCHIRIDVLFSRIDPCKHRLHRICRSDLPLPDRRGKLHGAVFQNIHTQSPFRRTAVTGSSKPNSILLQKVSVIKIHAMICQYFFNLFLSFAHGLCDHSHINSHFVEIDNGFLLRFIDTFL